MMKGYFLCIFALVALPNVIAIRCYVCTPSEGSFCTTSAALNDTDCDTSPGQKFDACLRMSYTIGVGGQKLTANAMACTIKAMCSEANKKKACDAAKKGSQQAGITMENCEIKCCSEDKCNDLDLEGPTDGTVSFRATSFFITFLSVTAISAGFFIH